MKDWASEESIYSISYAKFQMLSTCTVVRYEHFTFKLSNKLSYLLIDYKFHLGMQLAIGFLSGKIHKTVDKLKLKSNSKQQMEPLVK